MRTLQPDHLRPHNSAPPPPPRGPEALPKYGPFESTWGRPRPPAVHTTDRNSHGRQVNPRGTRVTGEAFGGNWAESCMLGLWQNMGRYVPFPRGGLVWGGGVGAKPDIYESA